MATLFNTRISDTYSGLIKTIDNAALTASLKELTDGSGLSSGVYMNTAGDFKVTAILEFGSLKDTGENIIISKFVDEADGIANNDNDTSIPTTAAIVDYVAAQITAEDLDFTGDTGSGQIDLDSQIFAIGGTSNEITTVASGQSLTLSLDSTGVNLPNNSTAITQTAGDNSTKIATTSYVDTLDAASDLDFSGDSGTGDVNLNAQTFAITGTTNQIITAASGQGLSLSLPTTVHRDLQGNVTGNVTGDLTGNVTATSILVNGVTATTQASSDNSTKVATTEYVKGLNNASDLDFTTDSGSGAVVLNSETFSVLGTTNEIETSGSGQAVTIGLPSTVNVNVTGNLTGNVTGNVTGDLTGDVTGNVTGNLTGNSTGTHTGAVIGNVTGNVTGDLTGNADSATKWQTARDLSVSGEATGTISSVDGTSNVSGALTLDNNSVTGKVLTGLTSPSASSVLATDTIVEGFGKLQSQVNGLANGLRFIGSWDADLNSPLLSDGGGESASGTTTGVATNKLIDSNASFTSAVLNDKVVNQVDGQTATVSAVDNGTQLTLSADIMLSGEAYTIDNSPYITQGHYYVVDNGGATNLNGISSWSIGDWVIAGANNEWTKLDHSQVDGTGTPTYITKWSANQVIADSIMSESGSTITVAGALTTNTNLSSTGNFAVNTDKFTANATSGNVAFTGDLAINTDKFTVNATSGSATFAGDLTTTAGRLQLGAVALPSAGVAAITNRSSDNSLYIQTSSGNTAYLLDGSQNTMYSAGSTAHNFYISNVPKLTIDSNGDSTFAGDVTSSGNIGSTIDANTTNQLSVTNSNSGSSATARVLIVSDSGNMQLKAVSSTNTTYGAGDVGVINCDTMSGGLRFAHNDQVKYTLAFDGENTWTGGGTFGGNVGIGVNASDYWANASNLVVGGLGAVSGITIATDGNLTGSLIFADGTGGGDNTRGGLQYDHSTNNMLFRVNNDTKMRIDSDGNVGIGTDSPDSKLQVVGAGQDQIRFGTSTSIYTDLWMGTGYTVIDSIGGSEGGFDFRDDGTSRMRLKTPGSTIQDVTLQLKTTGASDNAGIMFINSGNTSSFNDIAGIASFVESGSAKGNLQFWTRNSDGDNTDVATRMTIDSSGNVGIGVAADTSVRTFIKGSDSGTNNFQILTRNSSDENVLAVRNDGNVGIGTASPDAKLMVKDSSDSGFDSGIAIIRSANSQTGYINMVGGAMNFNSPSIPITFRQSGLEKMRITSGGDFGFNETTITNPYSQTNFTDLNIDGTWGGVISFKLGGTEKGWIGQRSSGNADMALGASSGQNLLFYTDGVNERMRIASDGTASLGNTSPESDVQLTVRRPNDLGNNVGDYQRLAAFQNSVSNFNQLYINSVRDANGTDWTTQGMRLSMKVDSTWMGYMQFNGSGNGAGISFGTGTTTSAPGSVTEKMRITSGGTIFMYGLGGYTASYADVRYDTTSKELYYQTSSKRYKTDIVNLENSLDKINSLRPVRYKDINTETLACGLIAEEVVETIPEVVFKKEIEGFDEPQIEGLNYTDLIPFLIKSIQELKAEVDKLKQECKCKN